MQLLDRMLLPLTLALGVYVGNFAECFELNKGLGGLGKHRYLNVT